MSSGIMCDIGGSKHDFNRRDSIEDKLVLEKIEQMASSSLNKVQSDDDLKTHESNIMQLGERYCEEGRTEDMSAFIKKIRPFLKLLSKAKAAKLLRALVDMFLDIDHPKQSPKKKGGAEKASLSVVVVESEECNDFMIEDEKRKQNSILRTELCKECIEWAREEKRSYLRQSLESRLVALLYEGGKYTEALQLIDRLLKELKKMDDKNLLVEVQLLECKTYLALGNIAKSRAALTSSRTTANTIYIPVKVQAHLDLQAGILHASSLATVMATTGQYYSGSTGGASGDLKTAYSHFYEAFEAFDSIDDQAMAIKSLKYMLLTKIMLNQAEEVIQIVSGKLALKYKGVHIEAMKAISVAAKDRSLSAFNKARSDFAKQLEGDVHVARHLGRLYQTMLEQNMCRIIEPYSKVQVKYIATKIGLNEIEVEKKLSQMILDEKINGILDQECGILILFEGNERDSTYDDVIETISAISRVVDRLYISAQKLT